MNTTISHRHFNIKDFHYLQKLRRKYQGKEYAYDAILYHMLLTTTTESPMDIPLKVKRAMRYYATSEGENVYRQMVAPKVEERDDRERQAQDGVEDIYEYSHQLAKAAQRDGNVKEGAISPEFLAAEALERFKNTI